MKKIIILSDTGDAHIDMLLHLKELFPECEIQILTYRYNCIEEGRIAEIKTIQREIKWENMKFTPPLEISLNNILDYELRNPRIK